jgi:hypothetical protein
MRKIKLLAIFLTATAFTAPAFSIFQLGVQGNYINDTFSNGTKYSGFGFGGFARFTVGIPKLITFGAGPYFDYGSYSGGTASSPDAKQIRVGGEVVLYADIIGNLIGVIPYTRLGFGYAGNTIKTAYSISGVSTSADAFYYGTGGHTIFGLTYNVAPLIYIFAEGGVQWSSLTASIPDTLKAAGFSASDLTTSGWRMSLGAMIWL